MGKPSLFHDYLKLTTERLPDKTALIADNKRWSYNEIDTHSDRLAVGLSKLGVRSNDRVAILLDNCAELVIAMYGTSKAAATFVVLSSTLKANKLAYILNNSGARVLITHMSKARVVLNAKDKLENDCKIVWITPSDILPEKLQDENACLWQEVIIDDENALASLPRADEQDLAAIIYTSGSTGEPKGVMQPHNKMIGVANSIIQYLENNEDDVILNVLSMSFGYGMYQVIMAFIFGGTVLLERSFVYLHKTLEKIADEGVTAFPFVPTIAAMMLQLETIEDYDLSTLRYVTNAGAALPVKHIGRVRELMPNVKIISMYGLTECVRVSYLEPDLIETKPDSVGRPIPNCSVTVVDEDGNETAPGQVGELVVTGDNVMTGYWQDPETTEKVFRTLPDSSEKVLYTGDLFKRDDDELLYFVSRKDDMIKTRGERVSPKEVENILSEYDKIAETTVIGVQDDLLGQAIKAFVVPKQTESTTQKDILNYCGTCMENFMVPKHIVLMNELPRNPNCKIDKKQLKAMKETS